MNNEKFTQSEWNLGIYDWGWYLGTKDCRICKENFESFQPTKQRQIADAHLISAAPDMYRALRKLVAWADGISKDACGDLEEARAALVKADGEPQ